MIRISVVILNYNGEKFIRRFLPSLIHHSPEAEIIVADNASTDNSRSILENEFPRVRLILLDKNYGFCRGYNRALTHVQSQYYLLLNSDIEVTDGWLKPILDILDRFPFVSAVQPKVLSYHNKKRFEYAGAGGGLIDALGYPFCRGRLLDYTEEDQGQYNDERQVFWASGACMAIRSETFHTFGGFDEDMFAHMEEIDLCWKINRAGNEVWYTGNSTVYHVGAGTLAYESPFKTYLNFRNGLILIYKHLSPGELMFKFPMRIVFDWVAALVFFLRGKTKNSLGVWKAHRDFFLNMRKHRKKRQKIQHIYPTYPKNLIYSGLIVFDYYVRKRKRLNINSPK